MYLLPAGFLIDRYEGQLFMAAVTSCMGAFFISIPFTTSLASLCVVATASEFFMGMVDTGNYVIFGVMLIVKQF